MPHIYSFVKFALTPIIFLLSKHQDLLPLLPDFTEIELFNDEICHTLEDCGARIDSLKAEMEELSESAESICKVRF